MPEVALYDRDIVAWANEQARLLRAGHLEQLDLEHIAEEIEDVGKSEQRELASRMAVLHGRGPRQCYPTVGWAPHPVADGLPLAGTMIEAGCF